MDEQNPYQSPVSTVEAVAVQGDGPLLAERMARLGAAILDSIIMLAVTVPVMWFGGYWDAVMRAAMSGTRVALGTTLLWSLVGFCIFLLIQGYPLHASGQTWGKRVAGVKIVDLDGRKPDFLRLLLRRYVPLQLASLVPFIGNILVLVDVLFIFRQDRRCLHDLIAGTRVVPAR